MHPESTPSELAVAPNFRNKRRCLLAFILLAVLAGPVDQYVSPWFLLGSPLPRFTSLAVVSTLALLVLVAIAILRRNRLPTRRNWIALLVLIVPQWCAAATGPNLPSPAWLHQIGWGTALIVSLAAPLWLAFAASASWIPQEVPRSLLGAVIVGVGALCLVLPADALGVGWSQVPSLFLNIALGVAIVCSWSFARSRLEGCPAITAAAAYLGLSVCGYLAFAYAFDHASIPATDWRGLILPSTFEIIQLALSWSLWFWLLQSVSLAVFSTRLLASCTAALLPGFVFFGFREWRMDAAVFISLAALAVCLRANPAQEQPTALGLANS